MGTYVNPGKRLYQMATQSQIYVDKTMVIPYLNGLINTQQRYVSVSRPRRFGKTITADMLCVSTFKSFQQSLTLLEATWNEDEAKAAELVEEAGCKSKARG